jgi:rhamnosyltransferase
MGRAKKIHIFPQSALAHKYCVGKGLEIGGSAHNAFGLNTLNVDFTDSTETEFKKGEIKLCGRAMKVDIVAPGDNIPLPDGSQDFVISSHVLEHFPNTIKALLEWDRLVRPGGILFMIVPHKERTFDRDRARTPLQHLIEDFLSDNKTSHKNCRGHDHCWITEDIAELVNWMIAGLGVRWEIVEIQDVDDKVGNGFTIVIRKKENRVCPEGARNTRSPDMKRLAVFAHYDRDDLLDDYVLHYLAGLKEVVKDIVFVSASGLPDASVHRLKTLCDTVVLRENAGYDFGSWQAGLRAVPDLSPYDEVIICNDSAYGPLFPLVELFGKMGEVDCDFWGLTESRGPLYHLQSYFLAFRRPVIASPAFTNFWQSVKSEEDKETVIRKYEVGLTQTLLEAGFRSAVYAGQKPAGPVTLKGRIVNAFKRGTISILKGNPLRTVNPFRTAAKWAVSGVSFDEKKRNVTLFFTRELVAACRTPFIKIGLLRHRPMRIELRGFESFLQERTDFPMELIRRHLTRVGSHDGEVDRFWR